MPSQYTMRPMSRRTLLVRLGLAGSGAVLAGMPSFARANSPGSGQSTANGLATHPIIGDWLVSTSLGPANIVFAAGGQVLVTWPQSVDGPNGHFEYTTAATGTWQPVSAYGATFTAVQVTADAGGSVMGTTTIESSPVVSMDERTFRSEERSDRLVTCNLVGVVEVVVGDHGSLPRMTGARIAA
jgi:hypothetical protein